MNRHAGANLEAAGPQALDEARQQGRAGHERHQCRRSQKRGTLAEHLHVNTIAADVAVHEHGDDAVRRETAADLKRRLERLTDLDRVGADRGRGFRGAAG